MQIHRILVVSTILLLQACASNEALFSQYDTDCLRQQAPVVIENIGSLWEPAVYFGFGEHVLTAAEQARLDANLVVLAENPELKVALQGFTDQKGDARRNTELARKRTTAVVQYLQSRGLEPERIKAASAGKALFIHQGMSVEDRMINRRVELMLLDASGRPLAFRFMSSSESIRFIPPEPLV